MELRGERCIQSINRGLEECSPSNECITNIPVVPRNYAGEIKDILISLGNSCTVEIADKGVFFFNVWSTGLGFSIRVLLCVTATIVHFGR